MKQIGRAAPMFYSMLSLMIQEKDAGLPLQLNLVFQDPMLLEKKASTWKAEKAILFLFNNILPYTKKYSVSKDILFVITEGFQLD